MELQKQLLRRGEEGRGGEERKGGGEERTACLPNGNTGAEYLSPNQYECPASTHYHTTAPQCYLRLTNKVFCVTNNDKIFPFLLKLPGEQVSHYPTDI